VHVLEPGQALGLEAALPLAEAGPIHAGLTASFADAAQLLGELEHREALVGHLGRWIVICQACCLPSDRSHRARGAAVAVVAHLLCPPRKLTTAASKCQTRSLSAQFRPFAIPEFSYESGQLPVESAYTNPERIATCICHPTGILLARRMDCRLVPNLSLHPE